MCYTRGGCACVYHVHTRVRLVHTWYCTWYVLIDIIHNSWCIYMYCCITASTETDTRTFTGVKKCGLVVPNYLFIRYTRYCTWNWYRVLSLLDVRQIVRITHYQVPLISYTGTLLFIPLIDFPRLLLGCFCVPRYNVESK